MTQQIAGVDTSVSSTSTNQPALKDAQEVVISCAKREMKEKPGSSVDLDYTPKCDEVEISVAFNLPADVKNLIQKQVTESLQNLMRNVLVLIDASVPNKDQNRAVKTFIQKEFDSAFLEILKDTDPNNAG